MSVLSVEGVRRLFVGLVAAAPSDGTGARVLRWVARLLAAALVAGGVILTLDGIMDV